MDELKKYRRADAAKITNCIDNGRGSDGGVFVGRFAQYPSSTCLQMRIMIREASGPGLLLCCVGGGWRGD